MGPVCRHSSLSRPTVLALDGPAAGAWLLAFEPVLRPSNEIGRQPRLRVDDYADVVEALVSAVLERLAGVATLADVVGLDRGEDEVVGQPLSDHERRLDAPGWDVLLEAFTERAVRWALGEVRGRTDGGAYRDEGLRSG